MADDRSGSGKSRRNGSAKSSNITDTVSRLTVRALQSFNLSEVEDANVPLESHSNTYEGETGL